MRGLLPTPLRVVQVLPGRTLGVIGVARYGAGSSLEYSELIVAPALARCGARLGAWVSHIYVDSPASVAGGRGIWNLPKELADFTWAPEGVSVRSDDRVLAAARLPLGASGLPIALRLPVFSGRESELLSFSARVHCRCRSGAGDWTVPPESPFVGFDLHAGATTLHLRRMSLEVSAPAAVRRPY